MAALNIVRREPGASGPAGGRLAVLVHGTMDRSTSFTRLMAKLPDWTVLTYDRRGYARSAHTGPPASFDEQVADLVSVIASHSGGPGPGAPAVAFGHSFGGDVVLATIACHPGLVTSAVVWEPPQPWLAWWPDSTATRGGGSGLGPEERAEWFMRRMVGDRVWEHLPQATRRLRRSEGRTLEAELRSIAAGPPFDPSRVTVPVIAGRGGKSKPHQRRSVEELVATLPDAQLAEIPGAAHGAHLSHAGEVAALLRRAAGVPSGRAMTDPPMVDQ